MRILFTTVGLSGHFFPLVPLAWACRALGHEVLVSTAEHFVATAVRAGLPTVSCGPSADFVELGAADAVSDRIEQRRHVHGGVFGRIAASGLAGTAALVRSWGPDVVVSERAEFAGPIAATVHGVPHVELQWGVAALDEYRSAATRELGRDLTRLGLGALPRPVRVLNPWPPSLRLAHTVGHQSLRHVAYNGDARVPDWAMEPRERPRICLTLGTVVPRLGVHGVSEIVIPTLENLAQLGFELVVAVADEVAATWPRLPDAVLQVGQVPLAQAMRACDVLIHHGGQGTALTALEAGRPQLVLPQFDDQLDNADAVVRAGAGLRMPLDQITPDAVTRSCVELLDTARFRRAATTMAAEIQAQPSPVEVARTLEEAAAGHSGSAAA